MKITNRRISVSQGLTMTFAAEVESVSREMLSYGSSRNNAGFLARFNADISLYAATEFLCARLRSATIISG